MQALLVALNLIKSNWKLLLAVFALGGTGAVASVVGLQPIEQFTADKIAQVAATISPTEVR